MVRRLLFQLLWLAVFAGLSLAASAADNKLDPTFGGSGDGRVTLGIAPGVSDEAARVLEAEDGSLYAVGSTPPGIGIVRLRANGTPDPQFAPVRYPQDDTQVALTATAAMLDAEGGIVVGGYYVRQQPVTGPFWVACRFLPDGTPDAAFGGGAPLIGCSEDFASVSHLRGEIRAMAIQPGGRIVFAGHVLDFADKRRAAFSSLGVDGYPDPTFSDDGIGNPNLVIPLAQVVPESSYNGLSLGGFDDLVAVGDYEVAADNSDILVTRLTGAGTPYPGFGANGNVIHALNMGPAGALRDAGNAIVSVQSRFVVAASAEVSATHQRGGVLLWLTANGGVDTTRGNNGRTIASVDGSDIAFSALATLSDARVVVAGTVRSPLGGGSYALVTRAFADGDFDDAFVMGLGAFEFVGTNDNVGPNETSLADVILQGDRIVVSGRSRINGQDADFGVARLGDRRIFNDGFETFDAP